MPKRLMLPLLLGLCLLATSAMTVPAHAGTAWWRVTTGAFPTHLPPGGEGEVFTTVMNFGDEAATGVANPVVIGDTLPPGLTATAITATGGEQIPCSLETLSCTYSEGEVEQKRHQDFAPYRLISVTIKVKVASNAPSGEQNTITVSGGRNVSVPGGAVTPATYRRALIVSSVPVGFGVDNYELAPFNEDGSLDTQAGSHPFQLTATVQVNSGANTSWAPGEEPRPMTAGMPKDFQFDLPAGLVGDPTVVPACTVAEFEASRLPSGRAIPFGNLCPANTAVGVAEPVIALDTINPTPVRAQPVPIFNLTPARGEPARFGFDAEGILPIVLDTSVRTGENYGLVVHVDNIPQQARLFGGVFSFWGAPADPRLNSSRGWNCLNNGIFVLPEQSCVESGQANSTAFLTLPTACTGSFESTVLGDSWEAPNAPPATTLSTLHDSLGDPIGLVGCNKLNFAPSISVAPDGAAGSTPTGLTVAVKVPHGEDLNPTGLSQADVRDTTVKLPPGVVISPAGGDGLSACSDQQIGFEGYDPQLGVQRFSPAQPACPESSKLGTVEITTPLLNGPFRGAVYLAAPQSFAGPPSENPFESLVALYVVAEEPKSGVLIKLAGKTTPDPITGQLVTTFESTPALPFDELKLHFFGGNRAPLTTPPLCGTYTTQASIAPWSGNPPTTPSSSFEISSGPNGAPCTNPQPFAPGFTAGSTNNFAAEFSPFTLTLSRPDADQALGAITTHLPPGLLGDLSKVALCPEPQAREGACGPQSLIGHTTVSAGLGGDPYTVTGGRVYITGPYKSAPYGLSIVNPAKAGPFDLEQRTPCDCVVVRAKIEVDPHTAALTITSDPLPTILQGIPLQIQHVNVTVDRRSFTFNPTDCEQLQVTGSMSSSEGASANVAFPFQVTNCARLSFHPRFKTLTSGRTSRTRGASLTVKLTYPTGARDANIAQVKVDLPRQLPARLKTLQKACPAATFVANPAACPVASLVGHTKATTPILPVPLSGPAYFVSHGGEAFPSLIIVLQGYGITIDLVGSTFISKAGITSSTFKTVPDVPVGFFELTLPQGKFSALAANGDLCKSKLAMPTTFVAQDGAVIHQNTRITVTGCTKHKAKKHHKAKHTKKTKAKH